MISSRLSARSGERIPCAALVRVAIVVASPSPFPVPYHREAWCKRGARFASIGSGHPRRQVMAAASPDERDAGPEETTLAEEEWPVSELYRVDPAELEAGSRDPDPGERPPALARRPVRRRAPLPFDDSRVAALGLALLAAILLAIATGLYVARGEEPAEATPAAGAPSSSAPGDTTPTKAAPSPPGASIRPLPDVTGVAVQNAQALLEGAGLRVRVRRVESDQSAGDVVG